MKLSLAEAATLLALGDRVAFAIAGIERRLELKDPAAPVRSAATEVLYLGQRVSRAGWRPRRATLRRFERRTRALLRGGDVEPVERSVASYCGVLGIRRRR